MTKIDPKLKDKMLLATQRIQEILSSVENLSVEECHSIIKRYTAAIEPNFLSWMAAASISGRSLMSKFAADENLWVEIKDDHPSMLRNFAIYTNSEPDATDFNYVNTEVIQMRNIASELSGLKNITMMATLENTSNAFIPWLAEIGKKLGCTDFTYTDIHGEADVLHADQFLEALTEEQTLDYTNSEENIDETISSTISLLKKCFIK